MDTSSRVDCHDSNDEMPPPPPSEPGMQQFIFHLFTNYLPESWCWLARGMLKAGTYLHLEVGSGPRSENAKRSHSTNYRLLYITHTWHHHPTPQQQERVVAFVDDWDTWSVDRGVKWGGEPGSILEAKLQIKKNTTLSARKWTVKLSKIKAWKK